MYALILNSSKADETDNSQISAEPAVIVQRDNLLKSNLARSSDLDNALSNAPQGLRIADYFTLGKFPEGNDNSAKIIEENENERGTSSILQVTDNVHQTGAIWSKPEEGNYIDVNRNQSVSMWMYFGEGSPLNVGDGMAFVLQNDKRKDGAISFRSDKSVGVGETLGVWGYDYIEGRHLDSESIAASAIQNSYAIEFDSYRDRWIDSNTDEENGNSFDYDTEDKIKGHHIAMNYPSDSNTYSWKNSTFYVGDKWNGKWVTKRYFKMNHKAVSNLNKFDYDNGKLTDGKWHHVTINWYKADSDLNGKIEYKFNDKNIDGTLNSNSKTYFTGSSKVDVSKFNLPKSGDNTGKLRWGFTGSTGKKYENNLIVFESVPSFMMGNVTSSLRDETQNKDIGMDKSVYKDDDLTFNYLLEYKSGPQMWEKIKTSIKLPNQVKFQSADIVYSDGKVEEINSSLFDQMNSKLSFTLQRDLGSMLEKATIRVHAVANKTAKGVGSAHGRFESKYLILDADTPNFNILENGLNITTNPAVGKTFQSKEEIQENQKVDVFVSKNGSYSLPKTMLYYKFNGKPYGENNITGLNNGVAESIFINKKDFKLGENIIEIYAVDDYSKISTKAIKLIYNVGRDLRFGDVSEEVYFQQINEGYKDELVRRKKGWKVEVIDNRSTGNPWKLYAAAVALSKDGNTQQQLDADLIFKHKAGNIDFLESGPMIDFGPSVVPGKKSTQITDHWSKDDGVLLKLNGRNKKGTYKTQICWSLYDTL
ncbi:hypothetical protein [Companilactobacillus mishanensis]|uniref:hypothetical protein n=1 Tax=Companilactobacillus mishanensis TaxID=2486008 RepID=UPI0012960940|nr:hypothetical protein [Companilactobacillus mishanensis]MQS88886.1 hypothetical protein [Companilactobacillus mishanensis]